VNPNLQLHSLDANDIAWTITVFVFAGAFLWRYWKWIKE
jgi:hypothetical protein